MSAFFDPVKHKDTKYTEPPLWGLFVFKEGNNPLLMRY